MINLLILLMLNFPLGSHLHEKSIHNKPNQWVIPFEASNGLESATYQQAIDYYNRLSKAFNEIHIYSYGKTDIGKPLHLVIISKDQDFDPESIKKANKRVLFINNGIHPGEPCGIDASMMLARDLMMKPALHKLLDHVVVAIIPVYNIGGALNRSCCSRANQIGPKRYGFRGNARNFDLDRDFVKENTLNAQSFAELFHMWNPDVLVDTHTSDGADYQYPMTLIATQKDKLQPMVSKYLEKVMKPDLYKMMDHTKYIMTPYVESYKTTPDSGIVSFLDTPIYSSGYAAMFNTISFISEAHMLHPFKDRVWGTYTELKSLLSITNRDYKEIGKIRAEADSAVAHQQNFATNWSLDTTKYKRITFKGYRAGYKNSKVTGQQRLYYDESKPYTKKIKYYNTYKATEMVQKPVAYLIPQGWRRVIKRLALNRVKMQRLSRDTSIRVQMYYIDDYKTMKRAYEAHYVHHDTKLRRDTVNYQYYKGDYVVYTNQKDNRYIIETLEPKSIVSFFNWNFFDSILMQKEYFSSYVFDDTAYKLLQEHPKLKKAFEDKRQSDPNFASNHRAQLDFIYKRSPYFERTYKRYPIGRLIHNIKLPLMSE